MDVVAVVLCTVIAPKPGLAMRMVRLLLEVAWSSTACLSSTA